MLQAIRTRAGSFVVKLLFGLLILSFGVWGIGDIFRDRTPETVVAKIGSKVIEAQQLESELQPALERLNAQFGGKLDRVKAKKLGIIDSLVEELVARGLIDQEAKRLDLAVSDAVVRGAIMSNPNFKAANGAFDRERFVELLAANHMNENQYVERLKRDIPAADILHAVGVGAAAPSSMVAMLYRFAGEKRTADIVSLPYSGAQGIGIPSEAQLQEFYDKHKSVFRTPAYRSFTLASLSPKDLATAIKIPEARLKEAYQDRRAEFVLPERRQVQQILAPSEKVAKAAAAALAGGQDWKDVATKVAGQAPDTIDLGLVTKKELPAPLADTVFSLPVGKPSAPVKSPLGWHILRVVKVVPPSTQGFAEAKPKLEERLALREAADRIYKLGNHVDDAIAGGMKLEAAAQKFGLKVTTVAAADIAGTDPSGKPVLLPLATEPVIKLAFAMQKGETSPVHDTGDGAVYVVRTDKVVPPRTKSLAEVRAQVISQWQADERRTVLDKEASALAKAVGPGRTLKQAAAEKGFAAATSPPLSRAPGGDPGVPAVLLAKLFAAKKGEAVSASDATGAYVAEIETITWPQADAKAAAALTPAVEQGLKDDLSAEFSQALRVRFPVEIRHEVIDKLF
ncbi:MAG TPA: peptidyl-prolyl cis-trans isomerase [Stellaceae bacterium]|nr:peptidyl-prolyl cis-trans isomerase [Stellaceae bacterium]